MNPLDDIRLKVDRAGEHIDSLDKRINSFLLENPYGGTREHNPHTNEYIFHFRVHRPPDDTWGVVVGDIAHNLRSGLDHIAYYVVSKYVPNLRDTGFPICTRREDFTRSKLLRGAPPSVIAVAESLQPYHSRDWPEVWLLEVLRLLNNRDKHTIVSPVFISPRAEIPGRPIQHFTTLKDGDIIKVSFRPNEHPHGKFFAEIAFDVPTVDPVTIGTLKGIHAFIRDEVVPRFSNFL